LIFAANDLPRINDSSNAIFRRLLLLDFNNVVDEDRIDVNLKDKIKEECPGIFNWAFEGLQRLNKNGHFTSSKDMSNRINEVKLLNNSIYYFIEENYTVTEDEKDTIGVDELYESYKDFCYKVGAKGIFKKPIFGKEINKVYIKRITSNRITFGGKQKRVWCGIREKREEDNFEPITFDDEEPIITEEPITWEE